ncbi:MAG: ferredoxin [Acidimicrobiales bacterium]
MRIVVDLDQCESNGLCMAAAPEVFELDDADELHILMEHPPPELRAKVERAVWDCPKQAITLEET